METYVLAGLRTTQRTYSVEIRARLPPPSSAISPWQGDLRPKIRSRKNYGKKVVEKFEIQVMSFQY